MDIPQARVYWARFAVSLTRDKIKTSNKGSAYSEVKAGAFVEAIKVWNGQEPEAAIVHAWASDFTQS